MKNENWQIIFRIQCANDPRPVDYCRETLDGTKTEDEVKRFAEYGMRLIEREHPGSKASYKVERW